MQLSQPSARYVTIPVLLGALLTAIAAVLIGKHIALIKKG